MALLAQAGSAYQKYEQDKRQQKRQMRELQSAQSEDRRPMAWATAPRQSVDYSQEIIGFGQAAGHLAEEFMYEDTYTNKYFEDQQEGEWRREEWTGKGPISLDRPPAEQAAYEQWQAGTLVSQKPDFDKLWRERSQQRKSDAGAAMRLANVYRGTTTTQQLDPQAIQRTAQQSLPAATQLWNRYGGQYQAPNIRVPQVQAPAWAREARQAYRHESAMYNLPGPQYPTMLYGLGAVGDPADPGPYRPITSPLAMPKGWEALVDRWIPENSWESAWLQGYTAHKTIGAGEGVYPMLLRQMPIAGVGEGAKSVKLQDVIQIEKYPAISGHDGGQAGWEKDWGNMSMLAWPAIKAWAYFRGLIAHSKLTKGKAGNWMGQLKWLEKNTYGGANMAWLGEETKRRGEWQKKRDAFLLDKRQKADEAARKKYLKDSAARAAAAGARARAIKVEEDKARAAAAAAAKAAAAAAGAQYGRRLRQGQKSRAGQTGQATRPSNTGLYVAVGAGLFLAFGMAKGRKK